MMTKSGNVKGPVRVVADLELPEVSLDLKDRALAATAEGITIVDLRLPDQPLIYVNEGFERLTLYRVEDILGRNCRFLQGPETDSSVTDEIRSAIRERRECTVEILNYRKDGVPFWNRLSLTPVRSESGETTHYIGVQSDVTKRRKAEEALHVANEKLEKANQRMSRDLEAAAKIQQSLLPQNLPEFEEASFCWEFEPCDELAGDFLNVLPLDGEHVAFYTLDVSGHGVPAALLSVSLSHWLSPVPGRSCLLSPAPDSASGFSVTPPSQVAEVLNREFPMDLNTAQYFTISYGVLNRATGRLRYVTAGSPPPLLVPRNGESQVLAGAGFPIGMFPKPGYEEQTVELSPGDRLFLFTDGVIEATNASDEPFWTDRLRAAVDENRSESLEGCLHSVLAEVRDWNAGDRFEDDATILALEFRGRT